MDQIKNHEKKLRDFVDLSDGTMYTFPTYDPRVDTILTPPSEEPSKDGSCSPSVLPIQGSQVLDTPLETPKRRVRCARKRARSLDTFTYSSSCNCVTPNDTISTYSHPSRALKLLNRNSVSMSSPLDDKLAEVTRNLNLEFDPCSPSLSGYFSCSFSTPTNVERVVCVSPTVSNLMRPFPVNFTDHSHED